MSLSFLYGTRLAAAFELFDESVNAFDLVWNVDLLRAFDCADSASCTSISLSEAWNGSVVADQVGPSVFAVLVVFLIVIDETFVHAFVVVRED